MVLGPRGNTMKIENLHNNNYHIETHPVKAVLYCRLSIKYIDELIENDTPTSEDCRTLNRRDKKALAVLKY